MTTTDDRTIRVSESQCRRAAATWYAVGFADGTGQPDRSFEFGAFAEKEAVAYYSGKVSYLASITDQWRRFTGNA